jgi:antitoxin (DNA-binding transcriptional repressor) of toxin-antitoxin stability system
MKTLTITDAKKNLGHWLAAAARGEDVGIIAGANIIALRKVEVTSVEDPYAYAMSEYGVTREEMQAFEKRMDVEYEKGKREKRWITIRNREDLEKAIEQAAKH